MPVKTHDEGGIAVVVCTGEYSLDALYDAVEEALGPFHATPAAGILFDLSGSAAIEGRSAEQRHMFAEFISLHGHRFGRRIATVVTNDRARFLIGHASKLVALRGVSYESFTSYPAACEWLLGGAPDAAR